MWMKPITQTYLKTYSHLMKPMEDQDSWPRLAANDKRAHLIPHDVIKMPGRPKNKDRKKDADEIKESKKKKRNGRFGRLGKHGESKSCGFCGEKGHNRTGCPHRKDDPRPDIPAAKGNPKPRKQSKKEQNTTKCAETFNDAPDEGDIPTMVDAFPQLATQLSQVQSSNTAQVYSYPSRRKSCKTKLQELQCKRASAQAHEMSQEMSQIPVETQTSLKAQAHKERPTSTPNAQAPLPPKPASSTPYEVHKPASSTPKAQAQVHKERPSSSTPNPISLPVNNKDFRSRLYATLMKNPIAKSTTK
ncbi:hypothetical protein OROGR_025360 [Orobanche gracilis]